MIDSDSLRRRLALMGRHETAELTVRPEGKLSSKTSRSRGWRIAIRAARPEE